MRFDWRIEWDWVVGGIDGGLGKGSSFSMYFYTLLDLTKKKKKSKITPSPAFLYLIGLIRKIKMAYVIIYTSFKSWVENNFEASRYS